MERVFIGTAAVDVRIRIHRANLGFLMTDMGNELQDILNHSSYLLLTLLFYFPID